MKKTGLIFAAFALLFGVIASSSFAERAETVSASAPPPVYIETPSLAKAVEKGELPPVAQRLPENPRVLDPTKYGGTLGRHGGRMRWLMGKQKDLRMLVYYSYARLVGYNEKYGLKADILEKFTVEDGRIFTFTLRKGHKWSDGHPFTTEDFRYWWEDVANDKRVGRGMPAKMLVNGKPPTVEFIDEVTVRFTWEDANPEFLPSLAATRPLVIFMPAHFMKQFHPRYADKAELEKRVKAVKLRNAKRLHMRMARSARPENPERPMLDPWIQTTKPPSTLFTFRRNPFYHRVDPAGRQLPYVDEVRIAMGSTSLIPAKVGAGDSDLQARYLRFDDYTFLKAAEKRGTIKVKLWDKSRGAHMAIVPNLNAKDPVWRKLNRDKRFRQALSLAINRREINQAIFYGLAKESADTILPGSPLYRKDYAKAFARFDLDRANELLDAVGLGERDGDGIRLLPDGRRAEIILTSAGESSEQADVLSLIRDTWRKAGIALYTRSSQRELFRKRIYSGETIMSVWEGLDNAMASAATSPTELAPTKQSQLHWPQWGLYYETSGEQGAAPDLPEGRKLIAALERWQAAASPDARKAAWHAMLKIHAQNVFTIGIVNATKQPVAMSPKLRNVPDHGVYAYEPGGFFGIYHPDLFWLEGADKKSSVTSDRATNGEPSILTKATGN
ncbi:MAG: ABC transporter substrate-binding protein [Pseudomonadota bacterium]